MSVADLFGIIVILYIIGAVVGAVLERMRRGPVLSDPVFPDKTIIPAQEQEPEDVEEVEDTIIVSVSPGEPMEQAFELWETEGEDIGEFPHTDLASPRAIPSSAMTARLPGDYGGYSDVTGIDWRRAVILTEILGRPRAVQPYRPFGSR